MKPILYSFRRCPYAMRARLAVAASGRAVELREILLRDKAPAFLEASPKGTVPVLVEADGTVIEESLEVMRWALAEDHPLMAAMDAAGWAWIETLDGPFKTNLDRYKYPSRYEEGPTGATAREANRGHLNSLDALLREQPYLSGSEIGFLDLATAPFIRQFAHVDRDWFFGEDWAGLQKWLSDFLESERFKAIMTKYPKWQEGDPPTAFP